MPLERLTDVELPNAPDEAKVSSLTGSDDGSANLVIDWDGSEDAENPVNWSKQRKWRVTGFACFMCFLCGINALSISSAASEINERFGISDASFPNSYWAVTSWNFGAALFPLVVLPLMEDFSVRIGYLASYTAFTVFVIPQALAPNFACLVVIRFFAGGCASIVQNGIENIIGDLWVGNETSLPVTMFIFAYLSGFTIGPVVGSAIVSGLYWRWIFYIELIIYGSVLPLALYIIPETRAPIILGRRAKHLAKQTGKVVTIAGKESIKLSTLFAESTIRPAQLFFTEPVVFFFTLWCALAVGNVFIATQSILQVYSINYGFSEVDVGYVQASMVVGEIVGFLICLWQNRIYFNSAAKNTKHPGVPIPEHRLQLSIPVSFVGLAGGLFIYAWTSYPSVPWIAPTIALGIVGVGVMVIVTSVATYLTDAYGQYAGSAIAAVAAVENLTSGFLPLAAQAMYTNLGLRWASSLLAFVALVLSFAPLVLYLKGPSVRRRSKFMRNL